ncbi:MAG: V-type ATP synthase subunit E [Candidatus Diapherotrites archaeon]
MSLEKLVSEIEAGTKKEEDAIRGSAALRRSQALEEARKEGSALMKKAKEEAEHYLREAGMHALSSAQLEADRIVAEAKAKAIEKNLERVSSALDEFKGSAGYADFLRSNYTEAEKQLGKNCKAFVNKDDLSLAKKFAKNVSSAEMRGGIRVVSEDGKVAVDASFESLMEEKKPALYAAIHEALFGGKK